MRLFMLILTASLFGDTKLRVFSNYTVSNSGWELIIASDSTAFCITGNTALFFETVFWKALYHT